MPSHPIRSVAVYCSARDGIDSAYAAAAGRLGQLIALTDRTLIYGGGSVGLMGVTSRACRAAGGRVVGVITERLRDMEVMDADNHENIVVRTMRERKAIIEHRADAMIVLPGGVGTMEEFFEILVGRILGEHDKPIFIINTPDPTRPASDRGFYAPLLAMIDHMIEGGFAPPSVRTLFTLCNDPDEAMAHLGEIDCADPPSSSGASAPRVPAALSVLSASSAVRAAAGR